MAKLITSYRAALVVSLFWVLNGCGVNPINLNGPLEPNGEGVSVMKPYKGQGLHKVVMSSMELCTTGPELRIDRVFAPNAKGNYQSLSFFVREINLKAATNTGPVGVIISWDGDVHDKKKFQGRVYPANNYLVKNNCAATNETLYVELDTQVVVGRNQGVSVPEVYVDYHVDDKKYRQIIQWKNIICGEGIQVPDC